MCATDNRHSIYPQPIPSRARAPQLLETMDWTIPTGPICQTYADELFRLADQHTGTVQKAPAILGEFK